MTAEISTVVLISGASRGLGRGLLESYLAMPNHTVIAANRDPASASSTSLRDIQTAPGTQLILVKLDANVPSQAFTAIEDIKSHGIDKLHLVVANAGISATFPFVRDLKINDIHDHMTTNVYGVVSLFQAALPLLKNAENPIWATMGSAAGWLENQLTIPNAAYAPSKAAVHWLTKKIDAEEESITAFVMDPGWVQTDMGNEGARQLGVGEEAPLGLKESVTGMKKVLDEVRKSTHGGKMVSYEGKFEAW